MTQEQVKGAGPTEEDLVKRALAQPLDDKIARSIGLLRMYASVAERTTGKPIWLAFSGGKDSCVIKQLAVEAGIPFEAWYNQTTIDPPELVRFIREHHADVLWNKPKMPLLRMLSEQPKGPPTSLMRWCCERYKEGGGKGRLRVIGVRVSESARRKAIWKEFIPVSGGGGMLAPICYWTDEDVWSFIRSRNLPYCSLYDDGFKRLGCVGCPLAGKKGQDREFARWPGYEAAWKRAVFRFWDKWHGVPNKKGERRYFEDFGSAQGLWDWWRSGKSKKIKAGCVYEDMMSNR